MEERSSLNEEIPIDRRNSCCMFIDCTEGHFGVMFGIGLSIFDEMESLVAPMKNSDLLNGYLF